MISDALRNWKVILGILMIPWIAGYLMFPQESATYQWVMGGQVLWWSMVVLAILKGIWDWLNRASGDGSNQQENEPHGRPLEPPDFGDQ